MADTENAKLRFLLALRVAGSTLYGDDGELQDCSVHPFIDFKRDTADEIERKLIERGMANARKSIGAFVEQQARELTDAELDALMPASAWEHFTPKGMDLVRTAMRAAIKASKEQ